MLAAASLAVAPQEPMKEKVPSSAAAATPAVLLQQQQQLQQQRLEARGLCQWWPQSSGESSSCSRPSATCWHALSSRAQQGGPRGSDRFKGLRRAGPSRGKRLSCCISGGVESLNPRLVELRQWQWLLSSAAHAVKGGGGAPNSTREAPPKLAKAGASRCCPRGSHFSCLILLCRDSLCLLLLKARGSAASSKRLKGPPRGGSPRTPRRPPSFSQAQH
ncbi:hypothetical protein Esti_001759 [Eimeria stiedai]